MAEIDENTRLSRSDRATFQVVADEAVLIHLDTGRYYSLNHVGTRFWEALDGEKSIAEQAAVLAEDYGVDAKMVSDDLVELARDLAKDGLIRRA